MENKFRRIKRTEIHKGKRVHLFHDRLVTPTGKEVDWELIMHPGASAVIPIDDEGKIVMVRQYRNASDDYVLEIPAGVFDAPDEDPLACARRELEEEIGYTSEDITFLYKFYSSIGICDEVIHIFVAKNLILSKQNLDDDEFVTIERYTLDELVDMVFDGRLTDNKTISAILTYKVSLERA